MQQIFDADSAALPAIDAAYVIWRLEEAGATLLALPASGWSTGLRSSTLDIVRSAAESYGWTEGRLRPPVPSAAKITRMDVALGWIAHIPLDRYVLRRIVGARSLVHPITERHLFPWRRLGGVLGADHKAVQRWHKEGIALIVAALAQSASAQSASAQSAPAQSVVGGTGGCVERRQPNTEATKRSRSSSVGGFSTVRATPSAAACAAIAGVGEPVISKTGSLSPAARSRATSSSPVTSGI